MQVQFAVSILLLRTVKGCVGKNPDAQGSGCKTRDLLKVQAEIRVKNQPGVRNTAGQFEGRSRDRVSKNTNRVEAGKSELHLT